MRTKLSPTEEVVMQPIFGPVCGSNVRLGSGAVEKGHPRGRPVLRGEQSLQAIPTLKTAVASTTDVIAAW